LEENVIGWLEDKLAGRQFGWGQGNKEYTATVFGNWWVQRGQYGLSLRWDTDENSRHAQLKIGPVGLLVTACRRREVPVDELDEKSTLKSRMLDDGRSLHTWRNWRHLGACLEIDPRGRMWRVEVGPFGMAVES
jgi:hypothetical protein